MAKVECTVTEGLTGERLDKAIVALVEGASRSRVKKAIETGEVRVNGRVLAKGGVVKTGDVISLEDTLVKSGETPCIPEPDAALEVKHESPSVIIADKRAGQPTAPLRPDETGTLASALVGHYPELAGIGYSPREPGIVHRLDTDTSGLVVVARTEAAFEVLREALQSERITKEYLLICKSEGLPDDGSIEHPIANHPKDKKRVYPCIHPRDVMRYAPRPALTRYTVVRRVGEWALVRATAPRAIRHQIRAHFASIGHALAGDMLYRSEASAEASESEGEGEGETAEAEAAAEPTKAPIARHALHAARVAFTAAPDEKDKVSSFDITSNLPADMQSLVQE